MDKALLPAGFYDSLFPEAGRKAAIMANLYGYLHRFGYELVEPPVIEFENSLFTGAGKALKNQTFRLMDPVSHKMMGVRSDITTQVARIAVTRLKKAPKPLRLSYGGDVFRVKGEGLYAERQLTQSGIELVGSDNAASDAEVVLVTVAALQNLGLKNICVDFTLPALIGIILDEMKYEKDERAALLNAINKKNIAEIERLAGANAQILTRLASPGITIEELAKTKLPTDAKPLCTRLAEVINIIKKSGEEVNVSIDPSESEKFGYHTGIGFTIFVQNAKGEIGRGGRYEIEDEDGAVPAVGATIYINEILRILLPSGKQQDKIYVPYGTNWSAVKNLLEGSAVVICGVKEVPNIIHEAKEQNCSFIFDGEEVVKA